MAYKVFTPSMNFLPVSFRLIKTHLNAVLWLIYLPALLMGLGQMLVGQVMSSHDYPPGMLTLDRFVTDIFEVGKGRLGAALMAAGLLWSIIVLPAILVGTLRAAKGGEFDPIHGLRDGWHYFWRVIGLVLLIGIIVEIGLFLFIIPGVIALRMLLLAPYHLVDKDIGIIEAMKSSARQSKLAPGSIYGVMGVLLWLLVGGALLGIIPVIGVVLSLLVTYLYLFGPALRYLELNRLFPSGAKKAAGHRRKN